ncbi:hypothetical protein [Robertmurraya massiliosenegalensis]|uniref:hypothetical protein n=1 Tax=Robertmurraya massiliosenegalensis TaxID=1287657 RepID=UPI000369464C|nr:hypothetical protein [Robertmurraya massiliosenegalensis]
MHFPNHREFYQRKLIPISSIDGIPLPDASHWLIALQGHNPAADTEFYHWTIVLYQTNSNGYFFQKKPLYVSASFNNFHHACLAANKLEENIQNHDFSFIPTESII